MTTKTDAEPSIKQQNTNLDRQYGDIGISAVAAALRYSGANGSPEGYAVAPAIDPRFIEAAA